MDGIKLNRLQRIGLLIAAIFIAWLLWTQIDENGLGDTNWLVPILAIIAILFVATYDIELRKSDTPHNLSAAAVGKSRSERRIALKSWRFALLIAAVTIPAAGLIWLALFGEKRAEEPGYTTDTYEGAADGAMDATAASSLDKRIRADFDRRHTAKASTNAALPTSNSAFFSKSFDRVSLQLPEDWHWLNEADAASLDARAEALTDAQGLETNGGANKVLVAGNALDNAKRSIATIRLSARPGNAASQFEMRQALREPQANIGREIVAEAEKTASAMRRLPATSYYRVTGGAFRQNASVVCLWTAFEYDVGKGPTVSDTWVCPLGDRTLKLSTSYAKAHSARFAGMIAHAWHSLDAR